MNFTAVFKSNHQNKRLKRYDIPPPRVSEYFAFEMSKKAKVILVSKSTGKRFYGSTVKDNLRWRCENSKSKEFDCKCTATFTSDSNSSIIIDCS